MSLGEIGFAGMGVVNIGHMWRDVGMNALSSGLASLGDEFSVDDAGNLLDVGGVDTTGGGTWVNPFPPSDLPQPSGGGALPSGAIDIATGKPLSSTALTQAIATASSLYKNISDAKSPYVLPGTNILYNPTTGQMVTTQPQGGSLSLTSPFGALFSQGSSLVPVLLLGGGILLLVMGMGGRR